MDRTVTFKQEETPGQEPQPGLDIKTDRLTDRQLQCDSDANISHNYACIKRTPQRRFY
jgi:hypothetical protein